MISRSHILIAAGVLLLAGCGDSAQLPEQASIGEKPNIPAPTKTLLPTVKVAEAIGWPQGAKPTPAAGFSVTALASGLQHPRMVYTLPNGDVLVAESDAPERPDDKKGIKGMIMGW